MAKNLHGYVGGVYKPTTGVQAYVGGAWKPAKSVRRFSNGAWTSQLETYVDIALSGTTIFAGAGIPSLIESWEWWYTTAANPTTWVKSDRTIGNIPTTYVAGATKWRAYGIQYDGTRLQSITDITVYIPPTSTVSLVAPTYCMCVISPNSTNNVIVNPKFTITVGTPASVKKVSLQIKHSSASTYTEAQAWTTGIAASLTTSAVEFSTDGLWNIQAVLTLTDDSLVTSSLSQMTCVKRTITVTSSDYTPDVGTNVTLTATLSSAAPAGFPNTPLGWEFDKGLGWVPTWTDTPHVWPVGDYPPHKFRWSEQFPDGSKIYSNTMTVTPTPAVVVKGTGGTNLDLQATLDQGYTKGLPVELTGTYIINARVYIPPNARVTATTATFSSRTGSQMFSNAGNGNVHDTTTGTTGYNKGGGWIWDGGNFDAYNSSSTAFSIVHCPKFTIQNCTIWNTMAHGIEINSSGGAPNAKGVISMADADFTIQILNNTFLGVDGARRTSDYDEAVHWDYSWTDGSSAGSGNDGTVCNNMLIKGNTFKRTRKYSYSVAIGQHHSISDNTGGRALPDTQHKNIKIVSNTIMDIVPVNVANERGAIHWHSGSVQVYVVSNNLVRCSMGVTMEPRTIPAGWANSAAYWITSNTFNACGSGNYKQVNGAAGGTGGSQWYNVTVNSNTFTGAIPATQTTYMISFPDTTTFSIVNNKFWGLTGGGGSPLLSQKDGNRIHGSPTSLPSGSTGMTLSGNTWCARADGVGAVSDNS